MKNFIVLGIDTSGECCSVGLAKGDTILGEVSEKTPQAHSDKLIPFIDKLFKENNLKIQDVNGIAISIGPGCFTGLRVGVATAKALAQGLDIPIVGVPTLDMIAKNIVHSSSFIVHSNYLNDARRTTHDALICPIVDARKQQVYTAKYSLQADKSTSLQGKKSKDSRLKKLTKDSVITIDELLSTVDYQLQPKTSLGATVFLGNAIPVYGDKIKESLGDRAIFAPEELWYPRASNVALEGSRRLQKDKKGDNLFKLMPIYLREPDIRKK